MDNIWVFTLKYLQIIFVISSTVVKIRVIHVHSLFQLITAYHILSRKYIAISDSLIISGCIKHKREPDRDFQIQDLFKQKVY